MVKRRGQQENLSGCYPYKLIRSLVIVNERRCAKKEDNTLLLEFTKFLRWVFFFWLFSVNKKTQASYFKAF